MFDNTNYQLRDQEHHYRQDPNISKCLYNCSTLKQRLESHKVILHSTVGPQDVYILKNILGPKKLLRFPNILLILGGSKATFVVQL